uniref:Uncharacterized protein n=1 Tax=Panagrolaimus sp. JU765 TaxID=591449 RepID=A0AC34R4B9_9BILA
MIRCSQHERNNNLIRIWEKSPCQSLTIDSSWTDLKGKEKQKKFTVKKSQKEAEHGFRFSQFLWNKLKKKTTSNLKLFKF